MSKKTRFYWSKSSGRWVPSGTSVIPTPDLSQWASNCAMGYIRNRCCLGDGVEFAAMSPAGDQSIWTEASTAYKEESKQAAGFGTFIHWACEQTLTQDKKIGIPKTWEVPDEEPWTLQVPVELAQKFMDGLWDWKTKYKVEVIAMEHEVTTDTYGGRLDLVCWMTLPEGRAVVLVDFKTGKSSYYASWKWQLSGYRQAWNMNICDHYKVRCEGVPDPDNPCVLNCAKAIKSHGILKFNKETGKVNWKSFDEYQATRTNPQTKDKEKYIRTYETDRLMFNALVSLWWIRERGIVI